MRMYMPNRLTSGRPSRWARSICASATWIRASASRTSAREVIACAVLRGRRRDAFADEVLQRLAQRQRRVRRHAQQPFQFHQSALDDSRLQSPIRLELLLFDSEHVAVQWWRRALFDPRRDQRTLPAGGRQQLLGHRQRPDSCQDLAVFEAHARGQRPLLIGRGLVRGIDLAIGNGDAAGLPVQIQRPLQLDARLVVGAARLLLLRKRDATGSAEGPPACGHPAPHRLAFARPEARARVRAPVRSRRPTSVHLRGRYRVRLATVVARTVPAPARPRWPGRH